MKFIKNFFTEDDERTLHIEEYERRKQFVEAKANEASKYATRWGYTHIGLGLVATTSAALCAIFTLSNDQRVVLVLSIISSVSAGCLTFLSPASREAKWTKRSRDCSLLKREIEEARITLYSQNSSNLERIQKLEELNSKVILF